ncbi:MAG: AbrB/MazE/SpoVT family DNA-binding domain-containing protein [Candidatus Woesearchaeota archaeon]
MKRKLNRVGLNTLTISIPSKWVKKHNLSAGDELTLSEGERDLIVSVEKPAKKIKSARLNLDKFNKMMVNRFFHEFYREGVEEIVVHHTRPTLIDYKEQAEKEIPVDQHIKRLIERFIGMEITSQTQGKIVIQSLMAQDEAEKIDVVKRRIYYLIKEYLEEFLKAMDSDFESFHQKNYDYHDNIVKFICYYLRLLHFSDISSEMKSRLFGLYTIVDKMIDKLRHTSERVAEQKKITKNTKEMLGLIFNLFLDQFDAILKENFSTSDLESLIRKRYDVVHTIHNKKFNDREMHILLECKILMDTIVDFSETYVALHAQNYLNY